MSLRDFAVACANGGETLRLTFYFDFPTLWGNGQRRIISVNPEQLDYCGSPDARKDNAYGMTIHAQVEKLGRSENRFGFGSVYTTLDRLEQKGYVKSWVSLIHTRTRWKVETVLRDHRCR